MRCSIALKIITILGIFGLTSSESKHFALNSAYSKNPIWHPPPFVFPATAKEARLVGIELAEIKRMYDTNKTASLQNSPWYYEKKEVDVDSSIDDEFSDVIPIKVPFNDTFAREVMHPIAAAAFATNPQLCLTNKVNNATLVEKVLAKCGPLNTDECSGFIALSHHYKAIIISFRGTTQLLQFINQRYQAEFESKKPIRGGGRVGPYYLKAFQSVWDGGLKRDFETMKEEYPTYDLWLTGYSLGGSMATIAAHIIAAEQLFDPERLVLMTFGEPRTGDVEFAEANNEMIPICYRVVGRDDIIPQLPLFSKRGYKHYGPEIWYDNPMGANDNYTVCARNEDLNCSTGKLGTISMIDHLFYYQRFIFSYGEFGCIL